MRNGGGTAGKAQSGSSAVKLLVRFYFGDAWLLQLRSPPKRGRFAHGVIPAPSRGSVFIVASMISTSSNPPWDRFTFQCFTICTPHRPSLESCTWLSFSHRLSRFQHSAHHLLLPQCPNARTPSFSPGSKNGSTRPENEIRRV